MTDVNLTLNNPENLQVVVGLGQSGLSAANYLAQQGFQVAVTDQSAAPSLASQLASNIAPQKFGGIDQDLLLAASRIIISPGISLEQPAIQAAKAKNIPVVSDIQLFCDANRVPMVAITGSNAKSTVTTLVGQMAKDAGVNVGVGGNIGIPALNLLENKNMQLAVLELSSFQLETVTDLNAQVATVLNMSPDHLDRHHDMLGYHQAKHRIFQGAKSVVVNRNDPMTKPLLATDLPCLSFGIDAPTGDDFGLMIDNGQTFLVKGHKKLLSADELIIKGRHNLLNAQAALALGTLAGLPLEGMLTTLKSFSGLEHRCQFIAHHQGVDYFNDSKGTNIGSTMAAIEGLGAVYAPKEGKLLLILGGQGKGQDFSELVPLINEYVSHVILIGEDAKKIAADLAALHSEISLQSCQTLDNAMQAIPQIIQSSLSQVQAVLLSPACASLDQFKNFSDRGECFVQQVHKMMA